MLARFRQTTDPEIAERTAKSCLLLPSSGLEEEATELAEWAITRGDRGLQPWALAARGLADYRQGHFGDALAIIEKSQAAMGDGAAWGLQVPAQCVRAMALMRLTRRDAAREALHKATAVYRSNAPKSVVLDPGPYWNEPLICETLLREAEALILYDPVFPADPFAPQVPE